MDMELNPWLIKFLKANKDLMFEALYEAAKQSETQFDDLAIELLEKPVIMHLVSILPNKKYGEQVKKD